MMPHEPDIDRKLVLHMKEMGFNCIRFFCHSPRRRQLDLCDELGLMAYSEPQTGWLLENFPEVGELMDISMTGLVLRNRNHPSVTMWGILNEESKGAIVFQHAVEMLPLIRSLDDTRIVMLNSGRFDGYDRETNPDQPQTKLTGLRVWKSVNSPDVPCVSFNPTNEELRHAYHLWKPGTLAMHSGRSGGVSSVARFVVPQTGRYKITAMFVKPDAFRIYHNGQQLSGQMQSQDDWIRFSQDLFVQQGDRLDFACVQPYDVDTKIIITTSEGHVYDLGMDIMFQSNPFGPWSLGSMPIDTDGKQGAFTFYDHSKVFYNVGSICNPGSPQWQDLLEDRHPYKGVPHTAKVIQELRTLGSPQRPYFMSEYGVGSGLNLFRMMRLYEQAGKEKCLDAFGYQQRLEWFMADWNKWGLGETFGIPDYYLNQTLAEITMQRLIGLNAIRANPNIIGYSLTGTADQGNSGEGVITLFRELKPGSVDAMIDGWAPLRWCLFAEPIQAYSGDTIHLEAVIANEDILKTGIKYPGRILT